jgi:hypothetical protein
VIPWVIKELVKDWALHSSLRQVIFKSALSPRIMIETYKVDMSRTFKITFVMCDCAHSLLSILSCVIWHARGSESDDRPFTL